MKAAIIIIYLIAYAALSAATKAGKSWSAADHLYSSTVADIHDGKHLHHPPVVSCLIMSLFPRR